MGALVVCGATGCAGNQASRNIFLSDRIKFRGINDSACLLGRIGLEVRVSLKKSRNVCIGLGTRRRLAVARRARLRKVPLDLEWRINGPHSRRKLLRKTLSLIAHEEEETIFSTE